MKHRTRKAIRLLRARVAAVLSGFALLPSCASADLQDRIASAADKRDVVCGLAANTPPGDPAVDRVRQLCKMEADLRAIARAYAGCQRSGE